MTTEAPARGAAKHQGLPKFFTPREVSEILGIPEQTLAEWRCKKSQPHLIWHKFGQAVRYPSDCLVAYIERSRCN